MPQKPFEVFQFSQDRITQPIVFLFIPGLVRQAFRRLLEHGQSHRHMEPIEPPFVLGACLLCPARAKGSTHQAAIRALAFKWIRILYRCWQTNTPDNESTYLNALVRRGHRRRWEGGIRQPARLRSTDQRAHAREPTGSAGIVVAGSHEPRPCPSGAGGARARRPLGCRIGWGRRGAPAGRPRGGRRVRRAPMPRRPWRPKRRRARHRRHPKPRAASR
jgi:hypothetical protein